MNFEEFENAARLLVCNSDDKQEVQLTHFLLWPVDQKDPLAQDKHTRRYPLVKRGGLSF